MRLVIKTSNEYTFVGGNSKEAFVSICLIVNRFYGGGIQTVASYHGTRIIKAIAARRHRMCNARRVMLSQSYYHMMELFH